MRIQTSLETISFPDVILFWLPWSRLVYSRTREWGLHFRRYYEIINRRRSWSLVVCRLSDYTDHELTKWNRVLCFRGLFFHPGQCHTEAFFAQFSADHNNTTAG